ncbi:FIMAH domain-containing protein [Paraliobacillus salinarum]|uniref:FIMAH domain-containing protein n=1 Tax=Paraliobacillus salinarum TaxID=1158996 RepID=UPI0015F756DE|nr:hypothetical protein [Paraliobacillus salinarum]
MHKKILAPIMVFISVLIIFSQNEDTIVLASVLEDNNVPNENQNVNSYWELKYEEDFSDELDIDNEPWVRDSYEEDSPWRVNGELDDNGDFFHIKGGNNFKRHLDSFWLMRKRSALGENDWLTVELAARDYNKDGHPENPVSFDNFTFENGKTGAKLDEPDYSGGGIIRSTDPLPPEYRIEYKLKTIDFGGMRNGSFEYDGKTNGYNPKGVKTNFPWKASGSFEGVSDPSNPNFSNVKRENGFYFLSIVDYDNPAPHNNIFIHTHRKVNMDAYNVNGLWSDAYSVCNPDNGALYNYNSDLSTRNAINVLFMNGKKYKDHAMPYNEFLIETECGSYEGDIVSAAEIQPELMPEEDYTFAIERNKTGYTMEISGNFLHAGEKTLRYSRDFIENGQPIYHYNNTPEQYDGQFDKIWSDGEYTIEHTWPKGSAYPDYFIIGDPHLTHYEGSATISDIKLYVPEKLDTNYIKTRLWQLYDAGEFANEKVLSKLNVHLNHAHHFETKNEPEKMVKHMKKFRKVLISQKNNDFITIKAFDILNEDANNIIEYH